MVGIELFCFFKQKTAYEMRISDWSSDVCSSDLEVHRRIHRDDRRALGGAVALQDAQAELLHPGAPRLLAHPLGAGEDIAHGIEVVGMRHAGVAGAEGVGAEHRSEERRVGKGCVSTCRYRWAQDH